MPKIDLGCGCRRAADRASGMMSPSGDGRFLHKDGTPYD